MSGSLKSSRVIASIVLVVIGTLAIVGVVLLRHDRLQTEISSSGQDTAPSHLGLTAGGFTATGANADSRPVANIAADLVTKALSFEPKSFDASVKAARRTMTGAMQKRYNALLASESTRKSVVGQGFVVTMTVAHDTAKNGGAPFLGVVSLTTTKGEFVMKLQRSSTTVGSDQAQVSSFVVDATVVKVGNTWMLNSLEQI